MNHDSVVKALDSESIGADLEPSLPICANG